MRRLVQDAALVDLDGVLTICRAQPSTDEFALRRTDMTLGLPG